MKKQFFYAAMALAVMSSCSKDNDPGIGNPDDNNDKAVITLGVDVPTVTALSRGTGSVGDVEGENNKWNSQRLYIHMVDREQKKALKEQKLRFSITQLSSSEPPKQPKAITVQSESITIM